jgi:UDP-glucose 4-epimerase
MKLLATGGAGYIGSIVVERAVSAGHEVVALDDLVQGNRGALHPAARLVEGDVSDASCLDRVLAGGRFDAVIHLAAHASVSASVADPAAYFGNNVVGTIALLDAMRRHGVERCVFSSTAAVYGEPASTPIVEGHERKPINAYGLSKWMCEQILEWYHRAYGLRAVAFRYFNAAGASAERGEAHRDETHLIPLVLRAAQGLAPSIRVFGRDYPTPDGTCIRDFVHVEDIADAHLIALDAIDRIGFDSFNLGCRDGFTVLEVIEEARRISGRPIEVEFAPRRPGDPAALVADATRAEQILNWRASRSTLPQILDSAWRWHQAHPHGYDQH